MDKQISVNLSLNAAKLFLRGLSKLPYEEVDELIKSFTQVIEKQLNPEPEKQEEVIKESN